MKPGANRTPATSKNTDPRTLRKLVAARTRALGGTASTHRWSGPTSEPAYSVLLWASGVAIRYAAAHRKPEFLTHEEFIARYAPTTEERHGTR